MPANLGDNDPARAVHHRPDILAAEVRPRRQHGRRFDRDNDAPLDRQEAVPPENPFVAAHAPQAELAAPRVPRAALIDMHGRAFNNVPRGAIDTHRAGADRDTRKSMVAVYSAFTVDDVEAASILDAVEAFIREYIGNAQNVESVPATQARAVGPITQDDTETRDDALRTLVFDEAASGAVFPFTSIRDPSNTYVTGEPGQNAIIPTARPAASLWKAIASLPQARQHHARLMYVLALAACQQRGHICPPGQLQQLTAHLAPELPELLFIRAPVREPHDYSAELYRFIKRKTGGPNKPVPEEERDAVIAFADKVWEDMKREDAQQVEQGYLDDHKLPRRQRDLREELDRLMNDTYDLEWSPPPIEVFGTQRLPTPMPGADVPGPAHADEDLARGAWLQILHEAMAHDPMRHDADDEDDDE